MSARGCLPQYAIPFVPGPWCASSRLGLTACTRKTHEAACTYLAYIINCFYVLVTITLRRTRASGYIPSVTMNWSFKIFLVRLRLREKSWYSPKKMRLVWEQRAGAILALLHCLWSSSHHICTYSVCDNFCKWHCSFKYWLKV